MTDDAYTISVRGLFRFLQSVSDQSNELNQKIVLFAERMGRITKLGDPAEFESIVKESSNEFGSFVQGIRSLFPEYRKNIELAAAGFDNKIESIDRGTSAGIQELEYMRREGRTLASTAQGVQTIINGLRQIAEVVRDSKHDPRLTDAANNLAGVSDELLMAYEDLETFALRVSFSADEAT